MQSFAEGGCVLKRTAKEQPPRKMGYQDWIFLHEKLGIWQVLKAVSYLSNVGKCKSEMHEFLEAEFREPALH